MSTTGDYAGRWKSEGLKGWEHVYALMARSIYDALRPWFPRQCGRAMELGCGDGVNTARIAEDFTSTVVIDFSHDFLRMTMEKLAGQNVQYVHSLVEEYAPDGYPAEFRKVDAIFAIHILEHLADPVSVLATYKRYLRPGGRILIAVPNANSFHRQLGVAMEIMPDTVSLNAQDRLLGHLRVYDMESLGVDLEQAGLEYGEFQGNFIKPLSARQMNGWGPKVLAGLEKMGKTYYGLAADLCVAAWKPANDGGRSKTDP